MRQNGEFLTQKHDRRKQFNFECDEGLILAVQMLASELHVSSRVLAEHFIRAGVIRVARRMYGG